MMSITETTEPLRKDPSSALAALAMIVEYALLAVYGLTSINVILILLLLFLIIRNIVKLFYEHRRGIIGSKLRTKLVATFVGLSLVPTILLFLFAINFLSSGIESWFNLKIGRRFKPVAGSGSGLLPADGGASKIQCPSDHRGHHQRPPLRKRAHGISEELYRSAPEGFQGGYGRNLFRFPERKAGFS